MCNWLMCDTFTLCLQSAIKRVAEEGEEAGKQNKNVLLVNASELRQSVLGLSMLTEIRNLEHSCGVDSGDSRVEP